MTRPFRVTLKGSFHAAELYDSHGAQVFDLDSAIAVANENFGDGWKEVYNGEEGVSREELVDQTATLDTERQALVDACLAIYKAWQSCPKSHEKHWSEAVNSVVCALRINGTPVA